MAQVSPPNPVLAAAQSQWLFSPDELARAPSVLDGMPITTEHTNRSKGINFILQVGIALKLPQNTLFTASIYLHRFFMRYSMQPLPNRPALHFYDVAGTALFLATKVDENCRKFKDYVVTCARVGSKDPSLIIDEQSKIFWNWRDAILHHENLLLEALCFDLQLELPHKFLWDFIVHFDLRSDKRLRNAAWAFLNDSMYTVLCLRFPARTIAAGALYAGARHVGIALPDDARGRAWWDQLDLSLADLRDVCNALADIYDVIAPQPSLKSRPEHIPAPASEMVDPTRLLGHLRQSTPGSGSEVGATSRKREREDSAAPSVVAASDSSKRQRMDFDDGLLHPQPPQPLQPSQSYSRSHSRSITPESRESSRVPQQSPVQPPLQPPPPSSSLPSQNQSQRVPHRIVHPLPPPPPVVVSPHDQYSTSASASASRRPSYGTSTSTTTRPPPPPPPVQPPPISPAPPPRAPPDETQQKIDSILYKSQQQARDDRDREGNRDRDRDRERDWSDRDREREHHARRQPHYSRPPPPYGSEHDQRSASQSRVPHASMNRELSMRRRSRDDGERYRDHRDRDRERDRERERERDWARSGSLARPPPRERERRDSFSGEPIASGAGSRRASISNAVEAGNGTGESTATPAAPPPPPPPPASSTTTDQSAPVPKGSTSVAVPSFGVNLPIIPPPQPQPQSSAGSSNTEKDKEREKEKGRGDAAAEGDGGRASPPPHANDHDVKRDDDESGSEEGQVADTA